MKSIVVKILKNYIYKKQPISISSTKLKAEKIEYLMGVIDIKNNIEKI